MSRRHEPQLDRRAFLGTTGAAATALALGAPGLAAASHGRPASRGRHRAVARWLEGYRLAWVQRDPDAAAALFTPDAVYQEQAFQPAFVGREAIRNYWATVTATQSDIELRYGRPVVQGRKAAVEWWTNLRNDGADVTLAGEFMLTFARPGLCSSLREYWFFSEGRLSPPPGWGE
jgi:ketosteroid isomerase-like protein